MTETYRRIVLARRPVAMPQESDFRMEEASIPRPGDGEVLIRNIYLSLDPYMRGRMRDVKSYAPPQQLDEVMVGGTVGVIDSSNNGRFAVGEFVQGMLGWQEYGLSDGSGLRKLDPSLAPISTALGILGMPGMTAYFGMLDLGQPKEGETAVISGAAGAVGALVGQIAKIKGCRAVGIAGTDAKCRYIGDELGFDAAINYKTTGDLREAVATACPDGVDVYFDNVGGPITDAVLAHINFSARIPIRGQISQYNHETPELGPRNMPLLLINRARMEGFIITDFAERWGEGLTQMGEWLAQGKLKYKEDIVKGLENAPQAMIGLLQGANFGKQLVQLGGLP